MPRMVILVSLKAEYTGSNPQEKMPLYRYFSQCCACWGIQLIHYHHYSNGKYVMKGS